jgi:lipopolysaccharide export system permease protein
MRMSFPDEQTYTVPIYIPPPEPYHRDHVAMSAIRGLIDELEASRERLRRIREGKRELGIADLRVDDNKIAEYDELIYRLKAEPYRRWSNGFACLCFALIGTPVAMLWRHADVLTNFFVCFLPILAIYYPLLMFGDKLSTSGTLPPISFWMGNVVLAVPAIALLRWIIRH